MRPATVDSASALPSVAGFASLASQRRAAQCIFFICHGGATDQDRSIKIEGTKDELFSTFRDPRGCARTSRPLRRNQGFSGRRLRLPRFAVRTHVAAIGLRCGEPHVALAAPVWERRRLLRPRQLACCRTRLRSIPPGTKTSSKRRIDADVVVPAKSVRKAVSRGLDGVASSSRGEERRPDRIRRRELRERRVEHRSEAQFVIEVARGRRGSRRRGGEGEATLSGRNGGEGQPRSRDLVQEVWSRQRCGGRGRTREGGQRRGID